jgi:hypothetical protein
LRNVARFPYAAQRSRAVAVIAGDDEFAVSVLARECRKTVMTSGHLLALKSARDGTHRRGCAIAMRLDGEHMMGVEYQSVRDQFHRAFGVVWS